MEGPSRGQGRVAPPPSSHQTGVMVYVTRSRLLVPKKFLASADDHYVGMLLRFWGQIMGA